ncbi:unnamed protein product [Prorocentrum cordatum]|uniref:Glyceraldehyde 3-phosphate dehydrogenase NAD(P) binding domain-containing protein n=1 Tax=Prorocentrum cordatum TaxID=2364126 RepID=A0ABN9V7H0_9DINO|nr:unnamed protein product [Polarella glacialis]
MPAAMGINGFGRIGRLVCRAALGNPEVQLKAINDPFMDLEYMVYMLKYDSVHKRYPGIIATKVADGKEFLVVDGKDIAVFHEKDPASIPWGRRGRQLHLRSLHRRVLCPGEGLSSPYAHQGVVPRRLIISLIPRTLLRIYVVFEVNHNEYKASDTRGLFVVSNASCTTNCWPRWTKLTVVGPSASGKDFRPAPDWRGGRCASQNIIPSSTGAAKAVGKCLPAVNGKLTGMAFRVPTPDVSVVDLTCRLEKGAKYDEIVAAVKEAAAGPMKGVLDWTDEEV